MMCDELDLAYDKSSLVMGSDIVEMVVVLPNAFS